MPSVRAFWMWASASSGRAELVLAQPQHRPRHAFLWPRFGDGGKGARRSGVVVALVSAHAVLPVPIGGFATGRLRRPACGLLRLHQRRHQHRPSRPGRRIGRSVLRRSRIDVTGWPRATSDARGPCLAAASGSRPAPAAGARPARSERLAAGIGQHELPLDDHLRPLARVGEQPRLLDPRLGGPRIPADDFVHERGGLGRPRLTLEEADVVERRFGDPARQAAVERQRLAERRFRAGASLESSLVLAICVSTCMRRSSAGGASAPAPTAPARRATSGRRSARP